MRSPRRQEPGPRQRSVWDFPRPPAYEQWHEHVEVTFGGQVIAASDDTWCALETSHPPTYYLPISAFVTGALRSAQGSSVCEWKGVATYFDIVAGDQVAVRGAWTYPEAAGDAGMLVDHVALYPGQMDACTVDGDPVTPQPGDFYGGWVTPRVTGPFKGEPGTLHW